MKKTDRKKLYKLLEEWTRAEILARHMPYNGTLEYADYFKISLEKEDEIRTLLYGSSSLVQLGLDWNLLKEPTNREKKHAGKIKNKKLSKS